MDYSPYWSNYYSNEDYEYMKEHRMRFKQSVIVNSSYTEKDAELLDKFFDEETEMTILTLKPKVGTFAENLQRIRKELNVQENFRGRNRPFGELAFGGNLEFYDSLKTEENVENYFKACYSFAVDYVGFLHKDANIFSARLIRNKNFRNLIVYYIPVTEKWEQKLYGSSKCKRNGKRLLVRDKNGDTVPWDYYDVEHPFLSKSAFWKERGGEKSYSLLQETFYQKVSSKYGAHRGESWSFYNNTCEEQAKRYGRTPDDEIDAARKSTMETV